MKEKTIKRNRKPEACELAENMGYFTFRCKDKKQAQKLMQEISDGYDGDKIDINKIEEERMYYHKSGCQMYTIGDDNICFECGETVGTVGRRTFVYYF